MSAAPSVTDIARYLDAIVELTRQHDPQELAAALLRILRANLHADRIRLLAISNENRDSEFHDTNLESAVVFDLLDAESIDAPRSIGADADLLVCVRSQHTVAKTVGAHTRIVFPVFGARHVWALLVIDGWRSDTASQDLIAKVLCVYSNQSFMLSQTQLDPLTGLFNRQSFYDRIRRVALGDAPRRRAVDGAVVQGNCFALFDIDFFKQVNDRYGHIYGDEVLLLLARLMARSFRHDDVLFRYGGEEFAAVLVNVDLDGAERMLERFRIAVENYKFPRLEPKTISIGLTTINVEQGVDRVVMCADKALYYAKKNGRNQVCCYEKLVAAGKIEPVTVAEGDVELF